MTAGGRQKLSGALELTWTNKDLTLLAHDDDSYEWVDPSDHRVAEVRLLRDVATVGEVGKSRAADNLVIRGDALNALQALNRLPEFSKEYVGKVRCVYIDPPFNTGQTFSHYDDALEHSVWLTMLRDRLTQIKPLLRPDGSVWVHLDDAEVHRARVVMDELFGRDCFVGTFIWQKADSPRNDPKGVSTDQDYIIVYSAAPGWSANGLGRTAAQDSIYQSPDGDAPWFGDNVSAPGGAKAQSGVYAIQSPFTGELIYPPTGRMWNKKQTAMRGLLEGWGTPYRLADIDDATERARICGIPDGASRSDIKALLLDGGLDEARQAAEDRLAVGMWPGIVFNKAGQGRPTLKRYLSEVSQTTSPRTMLLNDDVGHNRSAKSEIKALFPGDLPFATPKPERLLERVLTIATDPGDIVLDCFAGSGTTAAVAQKMGRRWVTVERSKSTTRDFIVPRLTKVVDGSDQGGISTSKERVPVAELPEGVTPEDAQTFSRVLGKLAKSDDLEDADAKTVKALRAAAKTRDDVTVNWTGGGGFRHLEVGPSMYLEAEGRVFLADWAVNGELAEAVAAQLGYPYEPEAPFAGTKGRTRLAVVDGLVNEAAVRIITGALEDDQKVVIAATAIDPDARAILRELRPGSTLKQIPKAMLSEYRKSRRQHLHLTATQEEPSQQATGGIETSNEQPGEH